MKNGFLSPEEARSALESLGSGDRAKLARIARRRSAGTRFEAADLIQETVLRILDGRRAWPRDEVPVAYLAGVMRSITSEWRKKPRDDLVVLVRGANGMEERDLVARLDTGKIIMLFENDSVAQTIIKGLLDGLRGEELQELSGLSETEYHSKRRAIRRCIDRYVFDYGKG